MKLEPILIKVRCGGICRVISVNSVHINYTCDARKGDGSGLPLNKTETLKIVLQGTPEDVIKYNSGQCYDGQYFNDDSVDVEFISMNDLPPTHQSVYDLCHQIELLLDVVMDNNFIEPTILALAKYVILPLQHGSNPSIEVQRFYVYLHQI